MKDNMISDVLHSQGFGSNVQSVAEDDKCCVLRIQSSTGEGYMTMYQVMQGVYIMLDEFHLETCESEFKNMADVFCIDHCRQGRIEQENRIGSKFYMESGDTKLGRRINHSGHVHLPNGYYYGMTIGFQIEETKKSLKKEFPRIDIDIGRIVEKFDSDDKEFLLRREMILRNDECLMHAFNELYNVPKEIRIDFFKAKTLEILLRLKMLDTNLYKDDRIYIPASQAERIKEVHKLITDNPGKNFTVEELSERFDIPESTLRKNFREIYGSPIYKYIKNFKVNMAAELLKSNRNLKISDVAESVGYDNPSKFAAAFKDITGQTPISYRNKETV